MNDRPIRFFAIFGMSLRVQIAVILILSVVVGAITGGSWYRWSALWEKNLTDTYEYGVSVIEVSEEVKVEWNMT